MYNILSCSQKRIIENCNFNTLDNAVQHPNRILSDTHDLLYILEGSWEVIQDSEVFSLNKDDVILLHAGHHHYGKTCCKPNTVCMFIHFNKLSGDCFSSKSVKDITWNDAVKINSTVSCKNNPGIKKLFKKIINTYHSNTSNRDIKLFALLTELFCELSDTSGSLNNSTEDEVIYDIINTIRISPEKNFTVKDFAEKHYLSETALTKRFKKATDTTIHSYQIDTKMTMAYNLISTDETVKIKNVATLFGFCDEYHFSKLFKKKFGVSPSAVRGTLPDNKINNRNNYNHSSMCW